jgi:hypothetical protein
MDAHLVDTSKPGLQEFVVALHEIMQPAPFTVLRGSLHASPLFLSYTTQARWSVQQTCYGGNGPMGDLKNINIKYLNYALL